MDPYTLANFKFAGDGNGGTILYDPPATAGQGGDLQPQIMQDPGANALNQEVALFSQQFAAAFASSTSGDGSGSTIGAEISSAQLAQIAAPVASHQQALGLVPLPPLRRDGRIGATLSRD